MHFYCNFSCHKEKKRNCETHYNIVSNFEKCVVFIFADDTAEGKGKRERDQSKIRYVMIIESLLV